MILKINGVITDVTKNDKSLGWNSIRTPDIENFNTAVDIWNTLDFSTPDTFFYSYMEALDKSSYTIMSTTEATEFLYRVSSWGVESFLNEYLKLVGMG